MRLNQTIVLCALLQAGGLAVGPVLGQAEGLAEGQAGGLANGPAVVPVKQVTAPAGDILSGRLVLPDPFEQGVRSTTALIRVHPEQADEDGLIRFELPAVIGDGSGAVGQSVGRGRVIFLPAEADAWVGVVTPMDRDGTLASSIRTDELAERAGVSRVRHPLPWGDDGRLFDGVMLPAGQGGMWIEIELEKAVGGYVLVDQQPDRSMYTFVEQRRTLVGEPISLVSSLSDGSRIERLRAEMRSPDGERKVIEAEAGSARLSFTPTEPGRYTIHVASEYLDADGWPVVLTTQHVIEVEEPAAVLGAARAEVLDGRVELGFAPDASNRRVILAAEVWGRAGDAMVPVCWLSRVCDGDRSLSLDLRWVAMAGVEPSTLELRQLRVHDVDSFVPLEVVERAGLDVPAVMLPAAPSAITPEMVHGRAPMLVDAPAGLGGDSSRGTLPGGHRLLLVHGYCSDGNPFTTSHFSGDIAIFDDPNVSRSHDAFALEILSQTSPMKSFGVAAHSQGGMAAVHLYTFYFSGLDWARGDRLIQTVGAPWQGTPLAGNAAVLGDVFGFGCGENTDLSPAGSANWLSLIPTSSRQMVSYYTTAFEDRPFAFDFCNFVTDLLLSDPDDGVIERSRGQLASGNNMGHVEGWCHTTGMRDPAQCTDQSRNTIINTRARR